MNYLFDSLIKKEQNKIVCLAKNYLKHVKEMGANDFPPYPLFFGKCWSSIVYEPNTIKIHTIGDHIIDHELELGFVIGKQAKNVKKEDALDYIKAYFLCLDLTDRTFQGEAKKNSYPWFYAKSQDCFLPISRFIEKNEITDPHNLDMTLWINDKITQQDNTSNMHYKIHDQLEFITKYVTLNPGDLVLTGTPSGVGPIKVGDKIKANMKQNGKIIIDMNYLVENVDDLTKKAKF